MPPRDLAEQIVGSCLETALIWNAADANCPCGYNPLTRISDKFRPLIDTVKKQWADAWGARMEHILRYAPAALLE